MQQQPQLQGVADLLANQGRYGDSMLVHMNPVEVQGLASMSPTGSLTVNPQTGQPEAFLPFLAAGLLGGLGGGALAAGLGLGTFGTLATKAVLTEAIAAKMQDRKFSPLGAAASGLAQFGVGKAAEALSSGVDAAVADATGGVGTGGTPMTTPIDAQATAVQDIANAFPAATAQTATSGLGAATEYLAGVRDLAGEALSKPGDALKAISSPEALIPIGIGASTNLDLAASSMYGDQAKDLEAREKAEYDRGVAQRDANVFDPNITPDPFATRPAYGSDYSQYANAGGIVSLDPNDFRRRFSELQALDRPVVNMYGGGPFSIPFYGTGAGAAAINPIPRNRQAALRDPFVISPEQLQQTYQEQGLPGFGPEIMYFTTKDEKTKELINPNPFKDWVTPDPVAAPPEGGDDGGSDTPPPGSPEEALALFQSGQITLDEYLERVLPNLANVMEGRAGGGRKNLPNEGRAEAAETSAVETTGTTTPAAGTNLTADEIADLYGQYMNYGGGFNLNFGMQEGGETQIQSEADRLIDLTQMAVLGRLPEEEADVVIQAFIAEFGEEAFQALRESILEMAVLGRLPEEEVDFVIQAFIDEFGEEAFQALRDSTLEEVVPGSQKEGEIVGAGGGMDDLIPGMIGDQQPVAVSPGEYIVPADVVSGIGDGSTDSGVQQLDGMLDRVRMERTGTTQQPAPLAKGGMLPR